MMSEKTEEKWKEKYYTLKGKFEQLEKELFFYKEREAEDWQRVKENQEKFRSLIIDLPRR